jgi:uncharacterized protein (TIGR02145 family)
MMNDMRTNFFKTAYRYCLLLLFTAPAICSCEKKEDIDPNTITLLAPAEGARFDLTATEQVMIEWSDVARVSIYNLHIGRNGDLSDAITVPLLSSPQLFPAKKLDAALIALGVGEGEEAALHWSVAPAIADATVETQVRTITLVRSVRPAIVLEAPADGATLDGRQVASFPFRFAWTPLPGLKNYVIKLSVNNAFPEDAIWSRHFSPDEDDDVASYTVSTPQQWDDILAKAGVPLNGSATVHWTVEPETPNPDVVSEVRAFTGIRLEYPTIYLTTPADGADLNANSVNFPVTFTWQSGAMNIPAYTLKISTDPAFPAGTATWSSDKNSAVSHAFNASEYDALLSGLGVALYEQQTLYWTVTPTTAMEKQITHTRLFTAVRKTVLTKPTAGASVIPDYKNLNKTVRFEWNATGSGPYELVITKDAAGNDVIANKPGISGAFTEFTHAELQALIDDPGKNLKRYKANELYWNVKVSGTSSYISELPCPVKLYGKRIFTDNRAEYMKQERPADFSAHPEWPGFHEPVQEYEVAVLQYNGKEVVWLAEDVRATCPWDSPSIKLSGPAYDVQIQLPMPEVTKDGIPIPDKYHAVRTTVPRTGYYYNTNWFNSVMPRGWKVPSMAEWEEMFLAAAAAYSGAYSDNVIFHPDFITGSNKEHANEWGMNFIPLGYYNYTCTSVLCITHFNWDDRGLYYQLDFAGNAGYAVAWDGYSTTNAGNANGLLWRGIYTGDD